MKAMVFEKYGSPDVLQLKELSQPSPKDNEVLVKIHATALNAADWHLLRADPFLARFEFGLFKPKYNILGADIAGRVEAVGNNVKQFKVGDEVFGDLAGCGFGGLAEYVAVPETVLAKKPHTLSFEQAAGVPMAAVTALQALRKGQVKSGQHILINGASGGVGTFAVQIAKALGAEVTATCSAGKMDMMRSLGADHVMDYTRDDFTQSGKKYDLIIGANGYYPLSHYKRALTSNGIYIATGGTMAQIFEAMIIGAWMSMRGKQKFGTLMAKPNADDLVFVGALIDSGKVAPVIDRCYSLPETPAAVRYLEEGHARGKIIITMGG